MNEEIIKDALNICFEIQKRGLIWSTLLLEGTDCDDMPPRERLYYKDIRTPKYLDRLGVIQISSFRLGGETYGIFKDVFDAGMDEREGHYFNYTEAMRILEQRKQPQGLWYAKCDLRKVDKFIKEQIKTDYPIQLIFSGNVLKIVGSALPQEFHLTTVQSDSDSAGILFDPIFKYCQFKPSDWHSISEKRIKTLFEFKDLQKGKTLLVKLPTLSQFSKYTSQIRLKKPIRSLFIGGIRNNRIKIRLAVPIQEWDNLSAEYKESVVKFLTPEAHFGN